MISLQWGQCFAELRGSLIEVIDTTQNLWNDANATQKYALERQFYCQYLRHELILAAGCIQICTNDGQDYFDRGQLLDWCHNNVSLAEFATFKNLDEAWTHYSCSQQGETCEALITSELRKTLEKGGATLTTLSAWIAMTYTLIVMWVTI